MGYPEATRAAAELELRRRLAEIDGLSLVEYVRHLNPTYEVPHHLQPIACELERAFYEPVECAFSAPPQIGKSELLFSSLARYVAKNPTKRNAYISYSATIAERKSRTILDYARRSRVNIDPLVQSAGYWKTREGGSMIAAGIGGPLTGEGIDGWLIIDDPHKSRAEAESPVRREAVHAWFTSIGGRIHPGASVFINHHRWHEDDMIGRLSSNEEAPIKWVNLPAIDEEGRSLWPSKRPIDWLERKRARVGPYDWESLFQGNPRPRGSKVFRDVHYYSELPRVFRAAFGVDCAYTAKKVADRSVCLTMLESQGYYYVVDVYSEQVESPAFGRALKLKQGAYAGSPMLWRGSGVEKGVAQHLVEQGADSLQFETVAEDKFIVSQPVAAAWNAGKILVPEEAPWLADFLAVVLGFTGLGDMRDDEVDALGSAFALLAVDSWNYSDTTGAEREMAGGLGGF